MKNSSLILMACAALLTSSIAMAEPKKFEQADANGDGNIDAAELKNSGIKDLTYEDIDTDQDGKITMEEYKEALEGCD